MDQDFEHYTIEGFLKDDFFIESVLHPTEESEAFWHTLLEEKKINSDDYQNARSFILSINENNVADLPAERWSALWEKIQKTNQKRKRYSLFVRYAAAACVISFAAGIYSYLTKESPKEDIYLSGIDIAKIKKVQMSKDIQLILSNDKVALSGDEAAIDYSSKGNIIVNQKTLEKAEKLAAIKTVPFNQLLVPYGKRSSIVLSDGSKIWVNAGTRVIYPVEFTGGKREIYVDGEIYGEIAHDSRHPFVFKTKQMEVEVLGTSLNIVAYEKEKNQTVVLINGSVRVRPEGGKEQLMKPNQLFHSSPRNSDLQEVDVTNYTSWIDGSYRFRHEELGTVLNRLSRYYGVEISCTQSAAHLTCYGSLDLKDNVTRVLDGLCQTAPISYSIQSGTYKFVLEP